MLRSPRDFEALQRIGRSRAHPFFVVRFAANGLDRSRFGFSTGRRLGTAVVRNQVRRRLRAIVRALEPRLRPGWDILVVCRPAAVTARQVELGEALKRLLRRAEVLEPEGTAT
jgi:ribonuclease P protein component